MRKPEFVKKGYREMKNEDALKLEPEQIVTHRRYGVCIVKEVMLAQGELFGVVIRPANQYGRDLLRTDCGCDVPDMLEDQVRNLSIEKAPAKPGEKPIDLGTIWGASESEQPQQEPKNHFAHDNDL